MCFQSLRRSLCLIVGWARRAAVIRSLSVSSWRSHRPSTTGRRTAADCPARPSSTSTSTTTETIASSCTFSASNMGFDLGICRIVVRGVTTRQPTASLNGYRSILRKTCSAGRFYLVHSIRYHSVSACNSIGPTDANRTVNCLMKYQYSILAKLQCRYIVELCHRLT